MLSLQNYNVLGIANLKWWCQAKTKPIFLEETLHCLAYPWGVLTKFLMLKHKWGKDKKKNILLIAQLMEMCSEPKGKQLTIFGSYQVINHFQRITCIKTIQNIFFWLFPPSFSSLLIFTENSVCLFPWKQPCGLIKKFKHVSHKSLSTFFFQTKELHVLQINKGTRRAGNQCRIQKGQSRSPEHFQHGRKTPVIYSTELDQFDISLY